MENVLFYEDAIVGTMENIWKNYKEELRKQMEDNTISFEELKNNFNEILEVMEEMENDTNVCFDTLVKIQENAMGCLYYKVLEEVNYE